MARGRRRFWSLTIRAAIALLVAGQFFVGGIGAVEAVEVPPTMADRRPVGAGPVEPGFAIDFLGVVWDGPAGAGVETHEGGEPHGAVRFRHSGVWGAWIPLEEDGAQEPGSWGSGLVWADGAEAYQVRGIPSYASQPRVVALSTTAGTPTTVGGRAAGSVDALANCLSRSEWGADESIRFDGDVEIWPPEFAPVQTVTVHHTVTANVDLDPAATVRAIYEFHTVDRGWGDIGYHMLIDEQGRVYEGRWSGEASQDCSSGGDGTDFGHRVDDQLVIAAHTGGFNTGNIGVALLGEFTAAAPKTTAVDQLELTLADLLARHGLDPLGTVDYFNPVNDNEATVNTISGHRDWKATECPGERLYSQLPDIRTNVATLMQPPDSPPSVTITSPVNGATVSGTIEVAADANDDDGVTQVEFFVDGVSIGTDTAAPYAVSWKTTTAAERGRTVTATATDTAEQGKTDRVDVIVDNRLGALVQEFTSPTTGSWQSVGDFDGDGRDDVVGYEPANGRWSVKRSTGDAFVHDTWATFGVRSGWGRHVVGDFSGDGPDDVASFHPSNGTWWVNRSADDRFVTELWADFSTAGGWEARMVGDFNGDGRDDLAQFHPSNGTWWISRSTGSGFITSLWADFSTPSGWVARMVGDFNADGRDDIAQFHPSNGSWWISRSTGSAFATELWADFSTPSGWGPQLVGDFNGDGRNDIAQYHSSNGTWWVSRSTGTGFVTTLWADFSTARGWEARMVGDFNGDGRDDLAQFHPSNGTWWISRSAASFVTSIWADFPTAAGWEARMSGDFSGNGKDDIVQLHPSNDTWWVSESNGSFFSTGIWLD
ncbi:MAG: FG-GAP-like repeat-containing protein [Acidimicrobiia bacterium]